VVFIDSARIRAMERARFRELLDDLNDCGRRPQEGAAMDFICFVADL
jgi:hypothetical protein